MGNSCFAGLVDVSTRVGDADSPSSPHRLKGYGCGSLNSSNLEDIYSVCTEPLAQGSFGTVRKASKKAAKADCVVKSLEKASASDRALEAFASEVFAHEGCDHPNIVRMYESFEDERGMHLVMEACEGGEVFSLVADHGRFREADAQHVMKQVLEAVHYMHDVKCIAHRDLKLENLMLKYSGVPLLENIIKVVDFGFAQAFVPGMASFTWACGTLSCMAPEIASGPYDEKCDVWSCGVMLHELLSGCVQAATATTLLGESTSDASFQEALAAMAASRLDGSELKGVSAEVKALLRMMCHRIPFLRASASKALHSAWFGLTGLR